MIRNINFKSEEEKDKIISLWYQAAMKEYDFLPLDYFNKSSKVLYDNLDLQDILVCDYKNDILGFIGMIDKEYISYLYVDVIYQHKGIGTALLNELKSDRNILKLKIFKEAKKSVNFFKNNGFRIKQESNDKDTNKIIYYMEWIK